MTNEDKFLEASTFVFELTGIDTRLIKSKSRYRDVCIARHLVRYYLRINFDMTYEVIAKLTNGHHSSAIHSFRYINDCAMYDKTYKLYKDSIDATSITTKLTQREKVIRVLSKDRSNEFKCNQIINLIKEEHEQFAASK